MKVLNGIRGALVSLSTLLFVPKCAGCDTPLPSRETALCEKCEKAYRLESSYLCKKCGRAHKMCICRIDFEGHKIPFTHVTGYDIRRPSVSKSLVLNIKNNRLDSAFDFLADEMLTAFKERYVRIFERAGVVITYVPRSKTARRRDGHDQSEQIAKRIAKKSGAVFMPLFANSAKKAQKSLSGANRQINAKKNYFLISPELKLDNMVIVIVDDIVTTGSSIGACAVLAKSLGAKAVIGLACAKTEGKREIEKEKEKSYIVLGEK